MKVAALLYYCTNDASSRLKEKFLWRAYRNLIEIGFDKVIIKVDGGIPPDPSQIQNHLTQEGGLLITEHEGINRGLATVASHISDGDYVMLVDPHNTYTKPALNAALAFLQNPKMQIVFQLMIPGRVRRGPWARFRTEMTNNLRGAENVALGFIARGSVLKRFVSEYLSKLDARDDSWWMAHFENWARAAYKEDEEWIRVPDAGDHDDNLDMWEHWQSIKQNGEKAGKITAGKLPPLVQMRKNAGHLLPSQASTRWMMIEAALFDLGFMETYYHVDENTGYVDLNYVERPEPPDLAGTIYHFSIDKYVVGSVLDLGCGDGRFLVHYWSMRPHYHMPMPGKNADQYRHGADLPHSGMVGFPFGTGVDNSPVAIRTAEAEAGDCMKTLNFVLGDFVGWDVGVPPAFGEDSYDTVVLAEVLEHLDEGQRSRALSVAWKIARHRVIVTLPMKDVNEPSHLKAFFTEVEVRTLFKPFVEKVTLGYADPSRWLVVAEKREVPNP